VLLDAFIIASSRPRRTNRSAQKTPCFNAEDHLYGFRQKIFNTPEHAVQLYPAINKSAALFVELQQLANPAMCSSSRNTAARQRRTPARILAAAIFIVQARASYPLKMRLRDAVLRLSSLAGALRRALSGLFSIIFPPNLTPQRHCRTARKLRNFHFKWQNHRLRFVWTYRYLAIAAEAVLMLPHPIANAAQRSGYRLQRLRGFNDEFFGPNRACVTNIRI
jgi:hypothetical protein